MAKIEEEQEEKELRLPILILCTKSDYIENINDEK